MEISDHPTSLHSTWLNGHVEPLIGSIRAASVAALSSTRQPSQARDYVWRLASGDLKRGNSLMLCPSTELKEGDAACIAAECFSSTGLRDLNAAAEGENSFESLR